MTKISIIIPILNEAETISGLLEYLLQTTSKKNISDIIVVDGGSTDNSQEIISKFRDVILINSSKGRAKQMNLGAQHASGEILYFIHADSIPPKNFDQYIATEIKKGNNSGCFKMKFDSNHWWLQLAGWFTQFNWKICRGGDQSLFILKSLFNEFEGFDEQYVIYEDMDLINKLYKRTNFVVIQEWLRTSARKYHLNGVWNLQYHFWVIHLKKRLGATPKELFNYYSKNIK